MAIALILLFAFSCTVKKRMYRDGYYVSWNKNRGAKANDEKEQRAIVSQTILKDEVPLEAGLNNLPIIPISLIKTEQPDSNVCGDTLILRSGTKYIVKVLEINNTEIKVKRCADRSGNILVFNLADVDKAVDDNGIVLVSPNIKEVKRASMDDDALRKEPDYKLKNGITIGLMSVLMALLAILSIALIVASSAIVAAILLILLLLLALNFNDIRRWFVKNILRNRVRINRSIKLSGLLFLISGILFVVAYFLAWAGSILFFPTIALIFLSLLLSFILSCKAFSLKKNERGKFWGILLFIIEIPLLLWLLILATFIIG